MKIYIKPYLRRIPIIDQLYRIVNEYGKIWGNDTGVDNFKDYNKALNNDPVVDFLDYLFPKGEEFIERFGKEQDRESIIRYVSNLFYETKGTYKVLDYITEYDIFQTTKNNGQDTTTEISYTTQSIDIHIKSLSSRFSREAFCTGLENFLCSLLYFQILNITIDNVETLVQDTTTSSLNRGSHFYQHHVYESSIL